MSHEMIELACIGVGALALLMQAILLLAIFLGMRKATKSLKEEIEDVRSSVMPVVNDSRELLTRLSRLTPKLESTVTDAAELTSSSFGETSRERRLPPIATIVSPSRTSRPGSASGES